MRTLKKTRIGGRDIVCGRLTPFNLELMKQFQLKRTSIWTTLYPEKANKDGLELDAHDPHSFYLALVVKANGSDEVVGGCRMIYADSGAELPVRASCEPGHAIEVSRFFLDTENPFVRAHGCELLSTLVEGIEEALRLGGFSCAYASIRLSLFEKLKLLGIPMQRIGENTEHGGKEFVPCRMTARNAPSPATVWDVGQYRLA